MIICQCCAADRECSLYNLNSKKMECLRCPACSSPYTDFSREDHLPRVLIGCGHTLCQSCITSSLATGRVICSQCKKHSLADEPKSLPVNETLLALLKSQQMQQEHQCRTHRKKLQVYCEKDKEFICIQCSFTTHRNHKASLISQKAKTDRAALSQSLKRIAEGHEESRKIVEKLKSDQAYLQSCFLDLSMEISVFYKHIIETVVALQQKEEESLRKQKDSIYKQIHLYKNQALQRQQFHQQLQLIYRQLQEVSDVEFLQRQNQQSFIINSSKSKRDKYSVPSLEFKRVASLQEVMGQLQEMMNFEKKKIIHSNSVCLPSKDSSALHGSPSLKKQLKQPAILQVNLSEQYNKRKANLPKDIKKQQKPAKKVISISTDKDKDKMKQKEKIIEAVSSSGRNLPIKDGKTDLRFIRESSIKKNRQTDSLFYDELQMSQNFTPMSVNSFMRTSRQSQVSLVHLSDSSIKHSFNSFSILDTEQKVYHFGGRTQSSIERYSKQSQSSQALHAIIQRKGMEIVYHRAHNYDKCLILGGVSNANNEWNTEIFQFNFKTQKLARTIFSMPQPRVSFGCISKEDSLYIVGGKFQKPLNTFERWDFGVSQLQVTKLPNMVQSRQDLGCCLGYDGFIYAAGGVNSSNNILNSCQRYNWHKKAWEAVPHMNRQRRSFTLVALPHGIMAIGGHSSIQTLPFVQILDFNSEKWVELAPLGEARCFHSTVVSKDYQTVTVFGGFANSNDLDSIQIYDIESNTWSRGGKMKQKRCLHASILSV